MGEVFLEVIAVGLRRRTDCAQKFEVEDIPSSLNHLNLRRPSIPVESAVATFSLESR